MGLNFVHTLILLHFPFFNQMYFLWDVNFGVMDKKKAQNLCNANCH